VLVDIGMPGRTGYEVAQHIKQSSRLKHIPVLLLTGAFEPVDQAKAAAAGCDGVLAKPFEPQLVIARVKELLLRGGQGTASSVPAVESSIPTSLPASPAPLADSWGTPSAEPEVKSPPSATQVARLDDYFDQLDAAFQTLGGNARTGQQKSPPPASPAADIIDWFGAPSEDEPDLPLSAAAPAALASPAVPAASVAPAPAAPPALAAPAVPVAPPALAASAAPEPQLERERDDTPDGWADDAEPATPRFLSEPASVTAAVVPMSEGSSLATLPPIADAFAAILAAEQHEPMPAFWPAPPQAPSNGGGALGDDAIEEITRRVLDRLSDRVVRDTVEDVISSIAERLVREEIDRIKSSIK
jgi:CheY-like chemotaxis protein